eukprot:CAMPEP_0172648576 /NCGR_PEP_ID=MMETSP1068-20121228/241341_1 /TAXON_ID=35684 /ORGANISM="Pseudopedinella elastica, Strain CCMP716" /LENGTH=541 /DNA_ID=CAMNT_0013462899 /DNA_START=590 /DNA_END=2215 /DNA_ORIENTATION=-
MAHPKVLRYSADDFESRVSLLQDILPGIEIRGVIQRQPTLLGLDPATILKPNLDRLGEMLNSSAKDVLRVVKHEPSLLAYDSQVLESKLGVLAQMFNFTVLKTGSLVASRAPGLLTLSIESNLRPSFEALQELLPANKHQIVRSAPSLLAYSEGKLREKVETLKRVLDLPDEDLGRLLALAPNILTLNVTGNLAPKLRELQLLFARKPDTVEEVKRAGAVRKLEAMRILSGAGTAAFGGAAAGDRKRSFASSQAAGTSGRRRSEVLGGILGRPGSKAGAVLSSSLRLKMAQNIHAQAGSATASQGSAPSVSATTSGGGGDDRRGLLAPLLPREEVIQLVARAPTLLQRNVSSSLAPKLTLLRLLMQGRLGGADCDDETMAEAADEVIRAHPRLLLSSFGVLGRVAFLAHQARQAAGKDDGPLSSQRSGQEGGQDVASGSSRGGRQDRTLVSGAQASLAIRAPRAQFFAKNAKYENFLRSSLLAYNQMKQGDAGAREQGGGLAAAFEAEVRTLSKEMLEKAHGDALQSILADTSSTSTCQAD